MSCRTLKRAWDWDEPMMTQRPAKRRRCNPFCKSPLQDLHGPTISSGTTHTPSNRFAKDSTESNPFSQAALPQMSPDKMAENLCNEIKRLQKRKQLPSMQDFESSDAEEGQESPPKGMFTFKQVQLICESLIKEREDQLSERYESVLTSELANQHEAFVKFTYEQIQRRYKAAPSYLL